MGRGRAPCCDKTKVKRGPWSPEEDLRLMSFIQKHGHSNWRSLPKEAGLLRCGKSCRLRWINYLRPDVKRGNFTREEEETIIKLHNSFGNKWSKIASHLPGRTDNEIKNVWHTHLKKRLTRKTEASDSPMDFSDSPSSPSTSITSNEDQIMEMTDDQTVQEPDAKNPNEKPEFLKVISRHPSDEPKETASSDTPTSSYASNFCEVSDAIITMPEKRKGSITSDEKIEIPFESDIDIWNLLDTLDPYQTTKSEQNEYEINSNSAEKIDSEDECKEWLRYLENELGLSGGNGSDNLPSTEHTSSLHQEMHFEPEIDYFPIWPSSPQNFGI